VAGKQWKISVAIIAAASVIGIVSDASTATDHLQQYGCS